MTARQMWILVALFVVGITLGYVLGTWYYMPRTLHINVVITEGV